MDELIRYDSDFSESKFKTKVDNIFVMLYVSFMTNNLDRVKHFISDEVYNEYLEKLNELNSKNLTQMYDELNVKSTEIVNIREESDSFIIEVKLISRYMDYLIDKNSKKLVSGDNTCRVEKTNYLTFKKLKNAKEQGLARKCNSCGANMDVNNTGKCVYCGTIYNTEEYDWILTKVVVS